MMRRSVRLYAALGLGGLIVALSLFAPLLATHDPRAAAPPAQLQPPSREHLFGTDLLGRDVYSRVLYGGRRTFGVALLTALITLGPGLLIGAVAGFRGGWIDMALMTLLDALLAVPALVLALALLTLAGSGSAQIAVAVGVAGIPAYGRVARAAVLEARSRPFVEAARAIGAGPAGILARHILPTIAPPLLAFAGVMLSWAILNSAALVFLGFGGDISAPDWGVMLADGRQAFRTAPWIALAPGVALSATVLAINWLADGLDRRAR
ncbi:MAG TPA: ABC transporter permease [Aggregatilineaceae bacterium]|nr:ABC transporter permease [Anaerolineae bacterium]HMM28105.1 ABC transporter permease [Aggregatilineaceae bacterium]